MATRSRATAATRRASRSTSPGEDPLLFDLGTGLRYFGLELPGRPPFQGTCLLSHLHWDHVQGLPFFTPLLHAGQPARRVRPVQDDGRTACRGAPVVHLPAAVPGRPRRVPRRTSTSTSRRRRVPIGGIDVVSAPSMPARRRHARLPRHARTASASPTSATTSSPCDGATIADGVARAVRGRRPVDPRRPVHAGGVRPEVDWGHCTIEYAVWLAGRGRCQAAGAVPPRPDPRRRHDRPSGRRRRQPAARRWASTCSPPAKGSRVELGTLTRVDTVARRRRHRAGRRVRGGRRGEAGRRHDVACAGPRARCADVGRHRAAVASSWSSGAARHRHRRADRRRSLAIVLLLVFSVAIVRQLVDGAPPAVRLLRRVVGDARSARATSLRNAVPASSSALVAVLAS